MLFDTTIILMTIIIIEMKIIMIIVVIVIHIYPKCRVTVGYNILYTGCYILY